MYMCACVQACTRTCTYMYSDTVSICVCTDLATGVLEGLEGGLPLPMAGISMWRPPGEGGQNATE